MSEPREFRFLANGIDSLDLGFYVDWREVWKDLFDRLHVAKQSARHSQGYVWTHRQAGPFLVRPSGTASGYIFHLKIPHADIFIAACDEPRHTPNVYISIGARKLWQRGPRGCAEELCNLISKLGGHVNQVQVSRCDLAADFWIDGGLSLDFLRASRVSRCRKLSHNLTGDSLETYYVGRGKGVVQARLYDKAAELKARPEKAWMLDVWQREKADDVWRVEFQLRRKFIKNFQINSLDDLERAIGGLWQYLTTEWLSFRLPDNSHATRRTVHPWWEHVQRCADLFAPVITLRRQITSECLAPLEWYISHTSGCLASYAARIGEPSLDRAIFQLANDMEDHWLDRDWPSEYAARSLLLDQPVREVEDDDIPI